MNDKYKRANFARACHQLRILTKYISCERKNSRILS